MAAHTKCEECGIRFTTETGRNYVMAPGGQMLDVCDDCADRFQRPRRR